MSGAAVSAGCRAVHDDAARAASTASVSVLSPVRRGRAAKRTGKHPRIGDETRLFRRRSTRHRLNLPVGEHDAIDETGRVKVDPLIRIEAWGAVSRWIAARDQCLLFRHAREKAAFVDRIGDRSRDVLYRIDRVLLAQDILKVLVRRQLFPPVAEGNRVGRRTIQRLERNA